MGSSPTRVGLFHASMAQRIAHRTSNPGVAGSNPAGGGSCVFVSTSNALHTQKNVENPGFDPGASSLLTTHSTD